MQQALRENPGKRRRSPARRRADHTSRPATWNWPSRPRTATCGWPPAPTSASKSPTTDAGIEPDVLPRIFEPFFTTKARQPPRAWVWRWVYGIVTNHGGGVAVSSQPGVGHVGARLSSGRQTKFVKRCSTGSHEDLNGNQTILMVDDEDLLLTMGETILSAYGYTVLTANSGQKALEILSADQERRSTWSSPTW